MQLRFRPLSGVMVPLLAALLAGPAFGQPPADDDADLRSGRNYIETQVYSPEDDQALLTLFEGLRVADVSDGMDKVGLTNVGLVAHDVRPLWRDTQEYAHRFIGITVTGAEQEFLEPEPFGEYPPRSPAGGVFRPGVVWFGEMLPEGAITAAEKAARECDLFLSLGTSGLAIRPDRRALPCRRWRSAAC